MALIKPDASHYARVSDLQTSLSLIPLLHLGSSQQYSQSLPRPRPHGPGIPRLPCLPCYSFTQKFTAASTPMHPASIQHMRFLGELVRIVTPVLLVEILPAALARQHQPDAVIVGLRFGVRGQAGLLFGVEGLG